MRAVLALFAAAALATELGSAETYFNERSEAYLTQCANACGGMDGELAKLETGLGQIDESVIQRQLDFMDERKASADFKATRCLRLFGLHGDSPRLSCAIKAEFKETFLDFKYWIDEPGEDAMQFWSENHFIMCTSTDYIAGTMYSNETFRNDGRTGAEHAATARPRVLQWLNDRMAYGFSEWLSS